LLALDERHLVFRLRFGEEVVDARLLRDGRGGERVVAGEHHGADAHGAQAIEALANTTLHDVLQVDDAEHARFAAVTGLLVGDDQRRAALHRDAMNHALEIGGPWTALLLHPRHDRVAGAFAHL